MFCVLFLLLFFFFNQKAAYDMRISDWSSDVCSSDLAKFLSDRGWRSKTSRVGWQEVSLGALPITRQGQSTHLTYLRCVAINVWQRAARRTWRAGKETVRVRTGDSAR